jgi:hypothetical protein
MWREALVKEPKWTRKAIPRRTGKRNNWGRCRGARVSETGAFLDGRRWAPTRRELVLSALAGLLLTGCSERLPTYRYRMTVEVETPEGLRTASSVIEVRTTRGSGFPGPEAGGIADEVTGEAVAVDLGRRGTLFALLRGPPELDYAIEYAQGIAPSALLPGLVDRSGTVEAWGNNLRALKEVRGSVALTADQYPLLVRFRDIADSRTVERVGADDLAAAFGEGVRLRRITVEIAHEPVTKSIDERLPWLGPYPEPRLDPEYRGSTNPTLPQQLSHGDFRRGS